MARLLAAPLLLLQPAAVQAEASAARTDVVAVSARMAPAAGSADPHAVWFRFAPRRQPARHRAAPLLAVLLPDDNVDDGDREALTLPAPPLAAASAVAAAVSAARHPLRRGGGIRGPPGARAPPALRVLRTALKESRGREASRRLSALNDTNNARPSLDAMRPAHWGRG